MRILCAIACAAPLLLGQQMADPDFRTAVADPAYRSGQGPVVLIDAAHNNVHTADTGYKPFAALMTADGYPVRSNQAKFTASALEGGRVLVIVNARGASTGPLQDRARPAFTAAETAAVRDWVKAGGALLIAADHFPVGDAMEMLSLEFGISMGKGHTLDLQHCDMQAGGPSTLVFSRENGLLGEHAITRGRNAQETVNRVVAFTGQSLVGPKESAVLMRLGDSAVDESAPPERKRTSAAGRAQGLALVFGKGRVVVLGEAAMLTAQVAGPRRRPMGMGAPNNDDRQFALNIMHWLSGVL